MMGKRQRSELCIPEEKRRRSTTINISLRLLEKKRPWSDLPEEIMEVIMSNLLFTDQVYVRAVCKRWRSIRLGPPAKQIPWLLVWHQKSMGSCKLYDPVYKKTYTINNTCLRDLSDSNAKVWASKDGWLLISYRFCKLYSLFLLCNLFTNERFDFPAMDHTDIEKFRTAKFSSSPISSDCIIFTMQYKYAEEIILIKTSRLGETTWTTNQYNSKFL
ncbi:hypothetical protein GIB67_016092 [Kingdonia uniflora]|uniref:F-box domain-containing protein n=1 Tax=Kingdonia uniflora TaxID=39325 RepID=A0A7J7L1Y0_9MAGN|nr:hypothetical protein GIB67_016092 [Kingdonia uniflora]